MNGADLTVLSYRFEGIARKMANVLLRTGRSGVLNRAKDLSCCIVSRDCELVSAAESLPIHVFHDKTTVKFFNGPRWRKVALIRHGSLDHSPPRGQSPKAMTA